MRSIIHFYMPSFHAAIEQMRNPDLAGKPVIVTRRSGGTEVVVSASSEAKLDGVHEGMTVRHAGRYCPSGIFVPADWGMYKEASENVLNIISDYSPLLEPHGLDRAYMDLTGTQDCSRMEPQRHGEHRGEEEAGILPFSLSPVRPFSSTSPWLNTPTFVVEDIQRRVRDEVGLVISAGIAQNKLLAYAAASTCGAGECIEIEPGGEREFLAPLPVSYLPGVGAKIEKRLLALGVVTIGELASIPAPMLFRQFGPIGSRLHRLAHGTDFSPVTALYPPETIIIKHTFGDMYETPSEPEAVEPYLLRMSDRISAKLVERNRKAGMVSLRIRFENGDSTSRSHVPKSAISSAHEIYSAARRILGQEMHGTEVVSIGLTLSDLRAIGGFQLDFLDDPERRMRIQALFGRIHARFGEKALIYGAALSA